MKHYNIHRLPDDCGQFPLAGEFDPAALPSPWKELEEAALTDYPWDETGYRPPAFARVGWNQNGLHVLMYAREAEIRTEVHHFGGRVCDDSCLEFFVQCNPEQTQDYLNLEGTAYPSMFISVGTDRYHRTDFDQPRGISPQASRHTGNWWALSYTIPTPLIVELFGAPLQPGQKMRGNFYICGDKTARLHYGMWNGADPAVLPKPDFHQPAFFAPMTLK